MFMIKGKTFKIQFWKKWLKINKKDTLVIRNVNFFIQQLKK